MNKLVKDTRYNIALVARDNIYYEQLSKIYYDKSEYQLGITCIPHITIAQFYENKKSVIENVVNNINNIQNEMKNVILNFNKASYKKEGEYTWLELKLSNSEICNILNKNIVNILSSFNIESINLPYNPHLTIAKIFTNETIIKKFLEIKVEKIDQFDLFIGYSDNIGQLASII